MAKTLNKIFGKRLNKKSGNVLMMELPAESYFEATTDSVKTLVSKGFEGIYISFQRPFLNLDAMLKQGGINTNKLFIIDVATAFVREEHNNHERCVHISPAIDIDELVRAIYVCLEKIKNKKKFVFIDSLTTITLYKPLSEVLRFSEFLTRTVENHEMKGIVLVFNVAKDLAQKRFIKDIALNVDEVITL